MFNKGYNRKLFDILMKKSFYMGSCPLCHYEEDGECLNPNVSEYDMFDNNGRKSCLFYTAPKTEE